MPRIVTDEQGYQKNNHKIDGRKQEPQDSDGRKMLIQQMVVLGNIFVVETGDPQIEEDIEKEGKIKDCKIKPIFTRCSHILYRTVNTENPEWLHKQVEKQKKTKIGYKFSFHGSALTIMQQEQKRSFVYDVCRCQI